MKVGRGAVDAILAEKVAIEAAVRFGWDGIIGHDGAFIGMDSFGASGPYKELYAHFGITPQAVVDAAEWVGGWLVRAGEARTVGGSPSGPTTRVTKLNRSVS